MTGYWEKELKEAVWNNRSDLIKICIEKGANPNWIAPGSLGRTQLFVAITHKKFDAAKSLVETGANPNLSDDFGKTPLQVAKASGLEEYVSLLEEYGAK